MSDKNFRRQSPTTAAYIYSDDQYTLTAARLREIALEAEEMAKRLDHEELSWLLEGKREADEYAVKRDARIAELMVGRKP